MSLRALRRSAPLLLAACSLACDGGCKSNNPPTNDEHPKSSPPSVVAASAPSTTSQRFDLVDALPSCDLDHRGLLFDAGKAGMPALIGRFGWQLGTPEGVDIVEHDGSTWIRVHDRKLTLSFVLTEATPIFVAARVQGLRSRSATVTLDEQPLGTLSLLQGQIRVASTGVTTLPADRGMHTITIRFAGRSSPGGDAFADIDWIRIGVPDESPATYGPPTLRDVILPAAALSGVPHRSIALRAVGSVRCAMHVPKAARLRAAIGVLGAGEGDAEIRALRDGKKPEVLKTIHLTGGDKPAWTDVDVPLSPVSGSLIALELRALSAPVGGRVLFGDPEVIVPAPPSGGVPRARAAVIVALDGVEQASLPPWNGAAVTKLDALAELAQSGTTYDKHRAPTTVVAGVMASLLTALPVEAHGLTDMGARLPAAQTTIAAVARDASVRTAMFTGVPFTFRAFGFGGAWERFAEHSPSSGDAATAPIDGATAWVTEVLRDAPDARLLAVVHARGGHPPWDISPKELGEVAPPDYAGPIDPRRAAQVLGTLRRKKGPTALSPTDLARVQALSAIALRGQDRAIGALIGALKTAGIWDSTLFIVTGDVSSGPSESALFADALDLRESALSLPLYVHFPGGAFAGSRVEEPTEIVDLPHTVLSSLGLSFSRRSSGRDLAVVASGVAGGGWGGPQVAVLDDRFSSRWGDLILTGRFGAAPTLCDRSVDPTCAFNRRDVTPLGTQAIFRRTVAAYVSAREPSPTREPATIDPETGAALRVWGVME